MGHDIITDEQVEAFERDGVVTVDTPWSGKLIEDVSEIMDRQLALYVVGIGGGKNGFACSGFRPNCNQL